MGAFPGTPVGDPPCLPVPGQPGPPSHPETQVAGRGVVQVNAAPGRNTTAPLPSSHSAEIRMAVQLHSIWTALGGSGSGG